MTDPVQVLAEANPVDRSDFVEQVPPLRLPEQRGPAPRVRRRPLAFGLACAAAAAVALVVIALQPSSAPGSRAILQQAFAQESSGGTIFHWVINSEILHVRVETWMRMTPDGRVDRMHRSWPDPPYHGMEVVTEQPGGFGDLDGAVTRDRRRPNAPIKTFKGMGGVDLGLTTVLTALNGHTDLGSAKKAELDGRPVFELDLGTTLGPDLRHKGPPVQLPVVLSVDRETHAPLLLRVGFAEKPFQLDRIEQFGRLPDDEAHRSLLEFTR